MINKKTHLEINNNQHCACFSYTKCCTKIEMYSKMREKSDEWDERFEEIVNFYFNIREDICDISRIIGKALNYSANEIEIFQEAYNVSEMLEFAYDEFVKEKRIDVLEIAEKELHEALIYIATPYFKSEDEICKVLASHFPKHFSEIQESVGVSEIQELIGEWVHQEGDFCFRSIRNEAHLIEIFQEYINAQI